jgi:hypothetical protein
MFGLGAEQEQGWTDSQPSATWISCLARRPVLCLESLMPKKLTLGQVARMARQHDAAAWDAMTPQERRELVERLNAESATGSVAKSEDDARHRAALAEFDRKMDILLGRKPKAKR